VAIVQIKTYLTNKMKYNFGDNVLLTLILMVIMSIVIYGFTRGKF